jgi:hypothetical protein
MRPWVLSPAKEKKKDNLVPSINCKGKNKRVEGRNFID